MKCLAGCGHKDPEKQSNPVTGQIERIADSFSRVLEVGSSYDAIEIYTVHR
jgi:hypothetical protein